MKFTFTDKASYLSWRQDWRENYAQLTASIRTQRRGRKMYLRTYRSYETPQGFRARELVSKMPNPHFGDYSLWQCSGLQDEARSQMEILKEAKALSWTLKQAAKPSAEASAA